MLKNLTNNAKNLAANAKIEDMTQLFKSTVGKQDVKHALSGVMDISKEVSCKMLLTYYYCLNHANSFDGLPCKGRRNLLKAKSTEPVEEEVLGECLCQQCTSFG